MAADRLYFEVDTASRPRRRQLRLGFAIILARDCISCLYVMHICRAGLLAAKMLIPQQHVVSFANRPQRRFLNSLCFCLLLGVIFVCLFVMRVLLVLLMQAPEFSKHAFRFFGFSKFGIDPS